MNAAPDDVPAGALVISEVACDWQAEKWEMQTRRR